MKDFVELGSCHKPHGIKGAFSFTLFNHEDSILEKGMAVTLVPKKGSTLKPEGEEFTIANISFGNKTIVFLKGINDRNQVEAMIPFSVFVPEDFFPETEEGEYFVKDLLDLKVVDHATGEEVGVVTDFGDNGQQVILEIRGTRNFEIPFIESFVPNVDLKNKKITVVIPEYIDDK